MELKDITVDAAKDVRGGSNSISQSSYNGGAYGSVAVGGFGFNLSPVSVDSQVAQANTTEQSALIQDLDSRSLQVDIVASQLQLGGLLRRPRLAL